MVIENATNANLDQVGSMFYNGIPTIKSKVNLANGKSLGGIMI